MKEMKKKKKNKIPPEIRIQRLLSDGKWRTRRGVSENAKVHYYRAEKILDQLVNEGKVEKDDTKENYIFYRKKQG